MYVICIMYFISATSNFMKFKLSLILNKTKKKKEKIWTNAKWKKKKKDFGNPRSSWFKTSIYSFFHHSYWCDCTMLQVRYKLCQCQIPHSGQKEILNLFNKSFTC